MKAIIKSTGEITTVECRWVTTISGNDVLRFIDQKTGISYTEHQLAILFQENNICEPDYWTRLEHTYAGMAMQGILSNNELYREICKSRNLESTIMEYASDLVKRLKEKEERR